MNETARRALSRYLTPEQIREFEELSAALLAEAEEEEDEAEDRTHTRRDT